MFASSFILVVITIERRVIAHFAWRPLLRDRSARHYSLAVPNRDLMKLKGITVVCLQGV